MKKIGIISVSVIIIFLSILIYFIWNFNEVKRLQNNDTEIGNVKVLAVKTIESLHLGDTEFLSEVSGTNRIKNMLFERMKKFENSNYDNIEVMEVSTNKRNVYNVSIMFTNDSSPYLNYTFSFKKVDNKWMIMDLLVH